MIELQKNTDIRAGRRINIGAGLTLTEDANGIPSLAADAAFESINLNDLANVTVPSPAAGRFLVFNGSVWVDSVDGSTLQSLNASQLASGNVPYARLPNAAGTWSAGGQVTLEVGTTIGTTAPVSVLRLGRLNPLNTGTVPGYGGSLVFSGGPAGATWDSDNSDPLWIARYNSASDNSELRVQISDDGSLSDAFVIGYIAAGPAWVDRLRVRANGAVTFAGALNGITTLALTGQLSSTLVTGTSPFTVTSTTLVTNLNAELLNGQSATFYQNAGNLTAGTLPYGRLPSGGGTWANGGTLSFTGGALTVDTSLQVIRSGGEPAVRIQRSDLTNSPRWDLGRFVSGAAFRWIYADGVTGEASIMELKTGGTLVMNQVASRIVPGITSFALRNNADSADNVLVTDAGAVTVRSVFLALGVIRSQYGTLGSTDDEHIRFGKTSSGASGNPFYVFKTDASAVSQGYLTGWDGTTSKEYLRLFYNTSTLGLGSANVPTVTLQSGVLLSFATAVSKILPGATSLSLRNNTDTADNLLLTDAGLATLRNKLSISGTFTDGLTITGTDAARKGILIRSAVAQQAQIIFDEGAGTGWQLGKQTDNTFFLFDIAAGANRWQVRTTGQVDVLTGPMVVGPMADLTGGLQIKATGTTQFQGTGIQLITSGISTAAQQATWIHHGILDAGATQGYFAIQQRSAAGTFIGTIAQYSYPTTTWAFGGTGFTIGSDPGGSAQLRIGGDVRVGATLGVLAGDNAGLGTPTADQLLSYNGSKWVSRTLQSTFNSGVMLASALSDGTAVTGANSLPTLSGTPTAPSVAPVVTPIYGGFIVDMSATALPANTVYVLDYSRNGGSYTTAAIVMTSAKIVHQILSNNTSGVFAATDVVAYKYKLRGGSDSAYSPASGDSGTATGSQTSTTLQDTTKSGGSAWAVNQWSSIGAAVRITGGTGSGQVRTVISNTSNTLTVSAWGTTPDGTSTYAIGEQYSTKTEVNAFGLIAASQISCVNLAAIAANIGIITAGQVRNASNTAGIELGGIGVQSTWNVYLDLPNKKFVVKDEQGSPVTRVLVGNTGGAATDYGIQVFSAVGDKILDASGATNGVLMTQNTNTLGVAWWTCSNPNTSNGNGMQVDFRSSTTNAGATTNVIFGALQMVLDEHDNATASARMLFIMRNQNNFVTRLILGTGLQIGAPTGGDKGIGTLNLAGDLYLKGGSFLARTTAAITNGAGASAATLNNAPVSGNPTKWMAVDDNGTTRYIPTW